VASCAARHADAEHVAGVEGPAEHGPNAVDAVRHWREVVSQGAVCARVVDAEARLLDAGDDDGGGYGRATSCVRGGLERDDGHDGLVWLAEAKIERKGRV
jgi:hypothetical protein